MKKFKGICIRSLLVVALLAFRYSTPIMAQTTLAPGDIAFTGYLGFGASASVDQWSFVLLKNITANTVIHFTENGWTTDNDFRPGENTITWTSNSALSAGQEISFVGTTPSLASPPGTPGTATGAAFALSANGDQVIAYQSAVEGVGPYTFISAIHSNVYTVANMNPTTTTAAAWEALNIANSTANSSAIPTGLTTGVNAIWIGTQGDINSEKDNSRFVCAGNLSTVASIKAVIYDQTKWTTSDGDPAGFTLPSGCAYISVPMAPSFSLHPSSITICEGTSTTFNTTAVGALSFQWQVDAGGGFVAISNNATYSGVTTANLTVSNVTTSMSGYKFRNTATNAGGTTNSNQATLTVTPLPLNPTLASKTPAAVSVAAGTPVSATFNAGSGGSSCTDDYRYTTDGGINYLSYTPGNNISTTGLAGGFVFIEGRRSVGCATCPNNYVVLASWYVTPFPAGVTTLAAGDIAFSGYLGFGASNTTDEFSFVLLKNMGPGTAITFTDNGYISGALTTTETTLSWTVPAGGLVAGTEIKIVGLTASKSGGGAAGTVTLVAGPTFALGAIGDQILAYTGTSNFISGIHMNVMLSPGDPITTTAAAWDGVAGNTSTSALPPGLITGTNAIWIGVQGDLNSEYNNARFGLCSNPNIPGDIAMLRAELNDQTNWLKSNGDPAGFTIPTGCNYLNALCSTIAITNPVVTTGTIGTAFNQSFTQSGGTLPVTFSLNSGTVPNGLNLTSAGVLSGTPTGPVGTSPITIKVTDANGCTGISGTYNLMIVCPTITGTVSGGGNICPAGSASVTVTFTGGTGPYTFTLDNSGGTVTGSSPLSKTVSPTMTTTYSVTSASAANGCPASVTGTATVTLNPQQSANFAYAKDAFCKAGTNPLPIIYGNTGGTFSAPGTVSITPGTGLINLAASTVGGPYTITYTNTGACPDSKTFPVSITNCTPGATMTDAIIIDNGTTGSADPNDRIRLTTTITNAQNAEYEGVQVVTNNDSRVTLVAGSFKSTPVAVNDLYATTLNSGLTVTAAIGVLANDFDNNIPGISVTAHSNPASGTLLINADGSFTYNPNTGFTGNDTFNYTITDSDAQTNSGIVKIHVQ